MGASTFGGGIVLGAAIAIFGRKILKANAERQREEEIRQLRANMLERQRLESKLNTLATQSATEVSAREGRVPSELTRVVGTFLPLTLKKSGA